MAGVQIRPVDLNLKALDESNQELLIKKLVEKIRSLEKDFRRVNAYLNIKPRKKLGIGPQKMLRFDVVYRRISRKDFDVVTKEIRKLKETLEHIGPTELSGKEIANVSMQENIWRFGYASCIHIGK